MPENIEGAGANHNRQKMSEQNTANPTTGDVETDLGDDNGSGLTSNASLASKAKVILRESSSLMCATLKCMSMVPKVGSST